MTLYEQVQNDLTEAIRGSETTTKGILRVLLGKVQTNGKFADEVVISTIKALIGQNNEEIATRQKRRSNEDEICIPVLEKEIFILNKYLPTYLTADQITHILASNKTQIDEAKNSGAAIGIAMKLLKDSGAVEGQTVKDVVLQIYQKN